MLFRSRIQFVAAALLAVGACLGCSDAPSDGPSACAGVALRVVLGPSPTRPGDGVRVYGTSVNGRSVEAVTDAQGAVCVAASDSDGAWTFTFARAGFGLATLQGVPRAGVEGAVRIDALNDAPPQPSVPISGQVRNGRRDATWLVDVLDGNTVTTMTPDYMTVFLPGDAPLLVSALELDERGDAVQAALTSAPRAAMAQQVDVTFPTTPRTPHATTVTITPPTEGVLTSPSQVLGPPLVPQYHTASSDTSYLTVGTARVMGIAPQGLQMALRTFDGDLLPDGALIGLLQPSPNLTLNAWVHDFAAEAVVRIAPLREFRVTGDAASTLALHAVAPEYDAAELVITRVRVPVPSWRIIAVNPGADVTVPTLPAGVNPSDHHLDGPTLAAQGLVVRMHTGTPWSAPAYNLSTPQYAYTVGGAFMTVRNDLR